MFDDIIKDKANSHEAPVPPDAWDNIVKQQKKRRFGLFWWSSVIVLLLCLSVAGYLVSKNNNRNATLAVKESNTIPAAKESTRSSSPAAIKESASIQANKEEIAIERSDNRSPEVSSDQSKYNSSTPLTVNTTGKNTDVAKNIERKNAGSNKTVPTQANSRKKKSFKGKSTYNSTGSEAEEILTKVENTQSSIETNGIVPGVKGNINNSIAANNNEENKAPVIDKAAAPADAEKKPATTPSTEIKKANTTLTKQSGKHHWFVDAVITPLLPVQAYDEDIVFNRTLFLNNSLTTFSATLVKTSIDPSMAFSIAVRRAFNKKITLGLGLQYLLLKENITISGKETSTRFNIVQRLVNGSNGPMLVNDTIPEVTEGTRNITAVNSYHLYSIPIFMQYNLVQKRSWNLSATGGVYVNISSIYQNEINRNAAALLITTPAATNTTSIGYDLFAGLRFGKPVGSKVEFFAMPSMRWNLDRYNIKNSLLRKTINQAGLSVGISYKVK